MRLYNNEAHLGGTLILQEKGMNGFGELGFKTATMFSKNFKFTRWDILSDTSSFYLKNTYREQGDDPLALKADGVTANVSFKTRKGVFNATNTKQINLPANLYYCLMDKFNWYMDGSTIDMEKNKEGQTSFETDASGIISNFYCYDPKFDDQHKINFKALNAKYDLKTQQIHCEKVANFPIGDVNIIPDSNQLTILKKGHIKPLINAIIETTNKIHYFEQCYIEVSDKGTYKANGQYRYTNSDNDVSLIKMENINCVDFKTKASGFIDDKRGFKLSKQFDYFGNIEVISNEDSIYCDGSTRIVHDCKYKKSWYAFKDKVQPKNIQIPIGNSLVNTDEQPLGVGFYWDKEKRNIYTTFLSPTNLPEDELLYTAQGYLQYSKSKNEFQISTKRQLKQRDENISVDALSTENYLSLDLQDNSCNMYGEGVVNFGINLGDSKIESYGTVRYDAVNNKKTTFNLTSRISFPVTQEVIENLAKKIKAAEEMKTAKVSEINQTNFDRAMKHWNTTKDYEKIREAVLNETTPKFPKQLEETIILSGLELISFGKNEIRGVKSNATNALLVSMYEKPVFKFVPIEYYFDQQFEETNSDKFGINFKVVDKYYYFDLRMKKKDGNMTIISNDDFFNKPIIDMKPKTRKIKDFYFESTENMEFYDEFKKIF